MWKTLACAVFILAGAAGVVASPTAAHAQPAPTDAKAAEDLAQQAFDAYQKGDFGAAIALYKKAYQSSAAGVILFNIANIYDKKLKDKDSAADYYRKYLRSGDTEPELVKRASERLDTVRAEIEASKQAQQDERNATASSSRPGNTSATPSLTLSQPPPRPSPPLAAKQKLGIAAGIAGVVGLGVSGYFGYQAKQQNNRADKGCNGLTACPDNFGLDASNKAHTDATISTISFVAGAALVATGVVLYIYGPSKKEGTIIGLTPQLGGLAITGAWQ
jgi:tetratricopeptide (TPR) repeat protein